jgi:uncharacterized protein (DUF427 family)
MEKAANPSPGFKRNPSYPITVEPFDGTVTVKFSNAVIASSDDALVLKEAEHPAVFYLPFKDIYFDLLKPADTSTHCPFKGDASYWNVSAVGQSEKDVMWAYRNPYDEMSRIKDHGAFYPDKVRIEATARALE